MLLKTFREINKSANKFYKTPNSFEHDKFIYECLEHLTKYFEVVFNDEFIYTAISFTHKDKLSFIGERENKEFQGHIFNSELTNKEDLFKILESFIQQANLSKTISLTKILLDKKTNKDVVVNISESAYNEELLNDKLLEIKLDYKNIKLIDEQEFNDKNKFKIETFKKVFSSELKFEAYSKYFYNYYTLAQEYSKIKKYSKIKSADFLIHFIKPSFNEFDYNLLLSLATSRLLTEDELAFINLLMHRIVSQTAVEKVEEVLRHATRAAISQVMARNLSHNIGSHVMNHLIDGKQIADKALTMQIVKENSYESGCFKLSNDELSYSYQLAYFNNYIKCRMDYLSEVTFGVPTMQTTKKIHAEVFRDFDKVRLLLNNISGINKFIYHLCFKFNGNKCCVDDVSVAFPSDILGVQAFYNILENIIRNTAKHDQNKGESTTFTINIQDIEPKDLVDATEEIKNEAALYYKVEITDGIKKEGTTKIEDEKLTEEVEGEYCKYKNIDKVNNDEWLAKRSENLEKIEWLIDSQNMKINQSVLDRSNNQLRTNSLGLLEMEASAAFLRKIDMPDIESYDYQVLSNDKIYNPETHNFNILKAVNISGALGYRIFLSKPQEFLFVGEWQIDDSRKSELLKHGIWFRSTEDFKKELENSIIFHHQFVLFDDTIDKKENEILLRILAMDKISEDEKFKDKILSRRTQLPIRCLGINGNNKLEICKLLVINNINLETLEEKVWSVWIKKILPEIELSGIEFDDSPSNADGKPNLKFVVLLNHKEMFSTAFQKNEKNKLKDNIIYIEPLSSYAQFKLPDNKNSLVKDYLVKKKGFNTIKKYKLIESIFSKVLVIDERIQNFANEKFDDNTLNKNIYDIINVISPNSTEIILDNINYLEESVTKIENLITKKIDEHKPSFFLIHYGIFERMYRSNKTKIDEKLLELAKKTRVIVTSGRGKQSLNLPQGVCYVNLSPISNVFIENRSKYSINLLLTQSRK